MYNKQKKILCDCDLHLLLEREVWMQGISISSNGILLSGILKFK